jgi:hypothetical protein
MDPEEAVRRPPPPSPRGQIRAALRRRRTGTTPSEPASACPTAQQPPYLRSHRRRRRWQVARRRRLRPAGRRRAQPGQEGIFIDPTNLHIIDLHRPSRLPQAQLRPPMNGPIPFTARVAALGHAVVEAGMRPVLPRVADHPRGQPGQSRRLRGQPTAGVGPGTSAAWSRPAQRRRSATSRQSSGAGRAPSTSSSRVAGDKVDRRLKPGTGARMVC